MQIVIMFTLFEENIARFVDYVSDVTYFILSPSAVRKYTFFNIELVKTVNVVVS